MTTKGTIRKRGIRPPRGMQARGASKGEPGRKKVSGKDLKDFQWRLRAYVDRYHGGSWAAFADATGLHRNTTTKWMGSTPRGGGGTAKAPDLERLLHLARETGLSLDWLLLGGDRPEHRDAKVPDSTLAEELESLLLAQFSQSDAEEWQLARAQIGGQGQAHIDRLRHEIVFRIRDMAAAMRANKMGIGFLDLAKSRRSLQLLYRDARRREEADFLAHWESEIGRGRGAVVGPVTESVTNPG